MITSLRIAYYSWRKRVLAKRIRQAGWNAKQAWRKAYCYHARKLAALQNIIIK